MSDDRDPDTGQFAADTSDLYGQAGLEAEAGFKPMPLANPVKSEPDDIEFNTHEAAEILAAARGDDEPVIPITYFDAVTGEPRDPNETVTLEQAAHDLATWHEHEADSRANSVSQDFADAIDSLRQPDAVQADEAKSETLGKDKTADEPQTESGLDAELERALKHPQVRQAVEEQLTEASQAREAYSTSLQAGQQMMRSVVASLAPGLESLPLEHWASAINDLGRTDPVRAQLIADSLGKWGQFQQADQQTRQHQNAIREQAFEQTKKSLGAETEKALAAYPKSEQEAATKWLVQHVAKFGVSEQQLAAEGRSNLLLTHPAFQTLAMKAAAYDRIKSTPLPKSTHTVPKVERPGVSQPRNSNTESISSLEKQFESASGEKQLRLAAQLSTARRAARG